MKDPRSRNHIVEIPIHWTAAQADAVFEFITTLETAVFDAYDKQLVELARAEIPFAPNPADESDDGEDIPF